MQSVANVTQCVREILHELGFVKLQPPKGWKKLVEEKLTDKNIDIGKVNIYQIRNRELEKLSSGHANVSDISNCTPVLKELRAFAQRVGGINKLEQLLEVLKSFQI